MNSRVSPVAAGVAGAVWIAVAGIMYRPDGSTALPIGCPFKRLTGFDCPGCGSTRALGALTHLDLRAALDHNALVPLALGFVVVSWVLWTWASFTDRPVPTLVKGPGAILSIGALLVGFAVLRNLDAGRWLASGISQ